MTATTSAWEAETQARLPSGLMKMPTGAGLAPNVLWKTRDWVPSTASRPIGMRLTSVAGRDVVDADVAGAGERDHGALPSGVI